MKDPLDHHTIDYITPEDQSMSQTHYETFTSAGTLIYSGDRLASAEAMLQELTRDGQAGCITCTRTIVTNRAWHKQAKTDRAHHAQGDRTE